ncbi:MAG: hypothetical protein V1818_03490 [Candidatus Aenigmatarchaeota archaeon]
MNVAEKGKFIVFYGVNSTGKSTQKDMLVNAFLKKGLKAEGIKYPIYDSESGRKINSILRGGKKQEISEFDLQSLYTDNRDEYEPVLKSKLENGVNVVSEDYRWTSLAWAKAKGIDNDAYVLLELMNSYLLSEDIAFFFDGKPFKEALEKNHIHESDLKLMKRSRETHRELAKKYSWIRIDSNQPVEVVHKSITKELRNKLGIL